MRAWAVGLGLGLLIGLRAAAVGVVRGTVVLEDGTPCAGVTVAVQAGEKRLTAETRADGGFTCTVPAGKVLVSVRGQTAKVVVADGAIVPVTLRIPPDGLLLRVVNGAGEPADVTISVAYRAPDGERRGLEAKRLGPGRFLLNTVPPTAQAVAVIADQGPRLAQYRREWGLDPATPNQQLTMTVYGMVPLVLTLVDPQGRPVADAPVRGETSYTLWDAGVWADEAPRRRGHGSRLLFTGARTDARGRVNVGEVPANCTLRDFNLEAGDWSGDKLTFDIREDGTPQVTEYPLTRAVRRTVTQRVCGADGTPRPGARVSASSLWRGALRVQHAVADAQGMVTWEGLPPAGVVVWGPQVPAGVIEPTVTAATAPLPAAKAGSNFMVRLRVDLPCAAPTLVRWFSRQPGSTELRPASVTQAGPTPEGQPGVPEWSRPGTAGVPLSALAIVESTPPKLAVLDEVYLPYAEPNAQGTLTMALRELAVVRVRFTLPDGTPLPGVSRLAVRPVAVEPPLPDFAFQSQPEHPDAFTLCPRPRPDGTYDLLLPAPGTYRLLVDAFDERVPAPPGLTLAVQPGASALTLQLPAPLAEAPAGATVTWTLRAVPGASAFTVPASARRLPIFGPAAALARLAFSPRAGLEAVWTPEQGLTLRRVPAEASAPAPPAPRPAPLFTAPGGVAVTWLSRTAPLTPRTATLADDAETAPFTAPPGGVLAAWYAPSPDQLVLWQDGTTRTVTRRSVFLQPRPPEAFYGHWRYRIPALLPDPGAADDQLVSYTPMRLDLWTGTYPVIEPTNNRLVDLLEVPAGDGPVELPVSIDLGKGPVMRRSTARTGIALTLPAVDVAAARQLGTRPVAVFDTGDVAALRWEIGSARGTVPNLPLGARTFSLQWPGVGVVRDLPCRPQVEVTAWEPGLTVTGTLLQADGTPWAHAAVQVTGSPTGKTTDSANAGLSCVTDAQGRFTATGLLPGVVCIAPKHGEGGFSLAITRDTAATLPMGARMIRETRAYQQAYALCGWIPAGQPMIPLLRDSRGYLSCRDLPAGPGALWAVDYAGRTRYAAFPEPPETFDAQALPATGPGLGLSVPFDPPAGFPETVYLTDAFGRTYSFPALEWRPIPQLGRILGQLDAVPPGDYTVRVSTTNGPVEQRVTVTPDGGFAEFALP